MRGLSPVESPALFVPHKVQYLVRSSFGGSARARARQYRLSWDEANPGSCGLQDGQHCHAAAEELESAAIGGNMLMVAGARAEEAAQFIVCATEPSGGSGAFEAPHWSVAPFDAAVVLLQPVIQVSTG